MKTVYVLFSALMVNDADVTLAGVSKEIKQSRMEQMESSIKQ